MTRVLDDVLHLLICPHCEAPLSRRESSVACENGHSFDVARQGYVGLLPGDARLGSADTAEMVAAREAFLGAGHFEPLADALTGEAERALAGESARGTGGELARGVGGEHSAGAQGDALLRDGCVIDLGAGTGWYLAHVLERLPGRPGLALDISKHALRRAARAHPRIAAVACDAWRRLPVRDATAAIVLSVFAPRNGPEIARVLVPGGALLVVTPTDSHLAELVTAHALLSVDRHKEARLGAQLDAHLDLERRVEREWSRVLTPADVANAVAMGPSARHVSIDELSAGAMRATASVTISIYRPRSG